MTQQLAMRQPKPPAERPETQRFFDRMLTAYHDVLYEKGLPRDDAARAASSAIANGYAAHNDIVVPGAARLDGLRTPMHEAFAEDAEFQRLIYRQKQELTESYAIIGMYIVALAKFNPPSENKLGINISISPERGRLCLRHI